MKSTIKVFLVLLCFGGCPTLLHGAVGKSLRAAKNDPRAFTTVGLSWSDPVGDTWCVYRSTVKSTMVVKGTLIGSAHAASYGDPVAGMPERLYFYQVRGEGDGCARAADDQVYCGDMKNGDTATLGSTMFSGYASCTARAESGPEVVYDFLAASTENFVLDVSAAGDLDLLVLDGSIDDRSCVAWGDTGVVLSGVQGRQYYVVVDGFQGAKGAYQLSVTPQDGDCGVVCKPESDLACATPLAATTAGKTNRTSSYDCDTWSETGPELIYRFTAAENGQHTAALSGMTANLDVFVLSMIEGCTGKHCVAHGDVSATFDATAGTTYYVVVDGRSAASGAFTLAITCPDYCVVDRDLACDTPVTATTAGGRSRFLSYSCAAARNESGPDAIYRFVPENDGRYTLTLSGMASNLDAFVLTDLADCTGSSCIAFADTSVGFDALKGVPYYIVVDGYNGASGAYTIEIACPDYCVADADIACDTPKSATTAGGRSRFASYGCAAGRNESGPDAIYRFVSTIDGPHTATLSGMTSNLDVFVLTSLGGCSGATCTAWGDTTAAFNVAAAGTTYYVVVDGFAGASGAYTLTVGCPDYCAVDADLTCGAATAGTTVGRRSRFPSYACAAGRNEAGPDAIYRFQSSIDGPHTVTLTGMTADLDVFVLSSLDDCSGATCVAWGDTAATFNVAAPGSATWYIVVDGHNGSSGSYTVTVACPNSCVSGGDLACDTGVNGTTTGGRSRIASYSCAPGRNESGPDAIYRFVSTIDGPHAATLSNLTSNLDVFVLTSLDNCSGNSCTTWGDSSASFNVAAAGTTYYVVVDGASGVTGPYTLTVTCPDYCVVDADIVCDTAVNGTTVGARSRFPSYGCAAGRNEAGPDKIYRFVSTVDGSHTATLSGMSANLDVFVLSSLDDCSGATCVSWGDTSATWSIGAAGETYYVVVDGLNGAQGSYTLRVTCPNYCLTDGTLSCGTPLNGDTHGDRSRFSTYSCWGRDESGPDNIYSFQAASTGTHTLNLTNLGADLDVLVLSSLANCTGNTCIAAGDTMVSFQATAGVTYYVVVDGFEGAAAAYTVTMKCLDTCALKGSLFCETTVNGDTTGGPNRISTYSCTTDAETGPEHIYAFTAPSTGEFSAALINPSAELDILVLSSLGTCNGNACIAYGDNIVTWNGVANTTYFIVVDGYSGAAGTYELRVGCATDCAAVDVFSCNTQETDTTVGAPSRFPRYDCSSWDETGPDYLYTFTAETSGDHTFSISTLAPLDVFVLSSLDSCSGLGCIASGDDLATFTATAGTTYYLIVDGPPGSEGEFFSSMTCPPSGPCAVDEVLPCDVQDDGDTTLGSNRMSGYDCVLWDETGHDYIYQFTAESSGSHTFRLTNLEPGKDMDTFILTALGTCTGDNCIAWGDVSTDIGTFDATAGTTYYLVVDGNMGVNGTYSVRMECPSATACSEDGQLRCDTPVNGTTVGGRSRFTTYNCWPFWTGPAPDVIYGFTAQTTGTHTVSLTNLVQDLDVFVLSSLDNCSGDTCIACGDATAIFDATTGTTYYIVVDGWDTAEGTYTVEVQCP